MKNPRYDDWWHNACTQLLPVLDSEDAALLQSEIAALDENLGRAFAFRYYPCRFI